MAGPMQSAERIKKLKSPGLPGKKHEQHGAAVLPGPGCYTQRLTICKLIKNGGAKLKSTYMTHRLDGSQELPNLAIKARSARWKFKLLNPPALRKRRHQTVGRPSAHRARWDADLETP